MDEPRISDRRQFLARLAWAPLSLLSCKPRQALRQAPAPKRPRLVVVHGSEPDRLLEAGLESLGFEALVRGRRVVLKPNATAAQPYPVTTDVAMLRGLVRLARNAGAAGIGIADAPSFAGLAAQRVFAELGYTALRREAGVEVTAVDPTLGSEFVRVASPEWEAHPFVRSCRIVNQADVVINLAIPKRHHVADLSCGLKNHFGCTSDTFRMLAHMRGGGFFDRSLVEFADAVRPELTIVDARRVLTRAGPTFHPGLSQIRDAGQMVLSADVVAVDAWCAGLMEQLDDSFRKATRVTAQLEYAQRLGLGHAHIDASDVVEIHVA